MFNIEHMCTSAPRTCCLDLDTFFVSVERLLDPSLEGKSVVVGGHLGNRGVVTAASYEVRALGVHSGMPTVEARRLAPRAIFLPTRHGVYSPYSARVRQVLEDFSPEVSPASIDEFYIDFHGCDRLYRQPGDPDADAAIERTVRRMCSRIKRDVGLPASAGIGTTRSIAKIASGLAKPAGVLMVRAGKEQAFLAPLSVRKWPGIGPKAEARLNEAGIHTLGQLLSLEPGPLFARFGALATRVRHGMDGARPQPARRDRPAFREFDPVDEAVGSISNERTFHADIGDETEIERQALALCERVCWRARKRRLRARTITLKLRYADFHTISRSRTVAPTASEARVFGCVRQLLRSGRTRRLPVRLLGVALSNLLGSDGQLPLPFRDSPREPGPVIDLVRARYGYDAIRLGSAGERSRWIA